MKNVVMNELSDYKVLDDDEVEESEFEEDGWDGTIPILMWAIRKGIVDKHLRAVGEVMRERMFVLYPDLAKATAHRAAGVTSSDWYSEEEAEALTLLGRDRRAMPVLSASSAGAGIIEFKGQFYRSRDLLDGYFRVPKDLLGEKGLVKHIGGKVVQIVKVGRTRVQIKLAEEISWASKPDFIRSLKDWDAWVNFRDIPFVFGD